MSRAVKTIVIALSLVVFLYVALGYVLGQTSDDRSYRALTPFVEVLQRIQQDYVEEPNIQHVTSGALHGLLEALDPQSSYLSPREYAEYKKELQNSHKGETGVELSKRFGYVVVVSVLPDSPAFKAGLRGGDILESIAGYTTREMSVSQAQVLLAGEPGTGVKVSVISRNFGTGTQGEDVDIVRREIVVPAIEADRLEGDVAYIRVPALNAGKSAEIRQKLEQFDHQGVRKLVLDLRECAMGEVAEAVETARLFVPAGTLATLKGQTVASKDFAAEPAKVVWRYPYAVLTSNGTAGAGEVLAAALGGNPGASGKVEIVGQRTFGTASEQKLIPLEDGSALVLTVAKYYTPAGKVILEEGVTPTVEVRDTADSDDEAAAKPEAPRDDAVLKKAIEILQGSASHAARTEPKRQAHLNQRRALVIPA
jgi:carboxyl-terminal processing protease